MTPKDVQTVVLRAPAGEAVAHLLLPVPARGRVGLRLLRELPLSFGVEAASTSCCSIGISFAGLQRLRLPEPYLQLFHRLAPAFRDGAALRSRQMGDRGTSAAEHWQPGFEPSTAHLVVSWHGPFDEVSAQAEGLRSAWSGLFERALDLQPCQTVAPALLGRHLAPPPPHREGRWVHFGYRDGLSDLRIDDAPITSSDPPDTRRHAAGSLVLGYRNDDDHNPYALVRAPSKVRAFFRHGSFGVLRCMAQDVAAFEDFVTACVERLELDEHDPHARDFVKAKLCGRWPNGQLLRPGDRSPGGPMRFRRADDADDAPGLDDRADPDGEGCPFGAHVRRMRAADDRHGRRFERVLQRRSVPFGPALWQPDDTAPAEGGPFTRGLLGHFFCASIEDQYEHLLGLWGARPPLGLAPQDNAADPLLGPHDGAPATWLLPLSGRAPVALTGFRNWTTTRGTVYAWYPGRAAWNALLEEDFVPVEDAGPWL